MRKYLTSLLYAVVGVFIGSLASLAVADTPFNVMEFDWGNALTVSGSLAVLALLHGIAARFQGDPDRARFTSPKR